MSLKVAAPLRGEAQGELWRAPRRVQAGDRSSMQAQADYDALVARFASATARGVVEVVPADRHVDKDYLDETGFQAPLLLRSPAQVDLTVPAQDSMTLKELETAIGAERPVRAIDVASQRELASEMKLKDWMQYFGQSPPQRDRVLNLISLECTGTGLDTKVRPPKMLREIGWVEKHWPALGGKTAMARAERARMPKVRLYCLMSAAGSYTEFHVDFGGSSVWYHLYKGRKFFYVIPPTDANLDKFATWEATYQHGQAPFFGDLVPPGECTVVEMCAGDTMLLPSGWMHAVYTPEDSISFGGNFLSGYHMATQLHCHAKEKGQQIEGRFFFPEFECVVWYAATYYTRMLDACPAVLSKWEKRDLPLLVDALRLWLSGGTRTGAGVPDPEVLSRVEWICNSAAHCKPAEMLQKMAKKLAELFVPEQEQKKKACEERAVTTDGDSGTATAPPSIVQASPIDDPHDSISRIATDDSSSSSSSSSDDSSSESSDPSTPESSDGEDTANGNDDEPPAPGDDDNGDTNESSSDSSSDDDSSSSSGSDNEEEKPNEAEDNKEPQREEEPEEFDEPEESSSSDSDNDFDPESAYPDLPPVPVDALIAIRKRAKLKELQITKQGKEEVIAMARQHLMERQKSARSKKKSTKAGVNGGVPVAITQWREDEHWVVACKCGAGGEDYDDGSEMVECNNCKTWVHIKCVLIPIHDTFWCFRCRDSDDWLFVCPCGVKSKNFDDGKRMVQCGICETWEHTLCGGIKDTEEPPEVYECTTCRKLRKKKRLPSTSQKNSKRSSKNKKTKRRTEQKSMEQSTEHAGDLSSGKHTAPPLPSPTTDSSSPPPPPPPPPSAPPSPVPSHHEEDHAASVASIMIPPDGFSHPVQKRKRGRPPLGKTKKKSKGYDEDYRESAEGRGSPSGGSLISRPPLPMTPKSSGAAAKRKSGSSARDRLEKKLKTRKSRA